MNDVVTKITEDSRAITRHWADPENLSAIILRLALLYADIGDLVTEAEFEMDAAKSEYEHNVEESKLALIKKGDSATKAESEARLEFKDDRLSYLECKRKYGLLKRKRESLGTVIDAARSRLSLIKGDIARQQ